MSLALSMTIGVLFGAGCMLMLRRDLFRLVAGAILLTNATNLLLVSSSRAPRVEDLDLLGSTVEMDPLVQAMTLTSIVITFGVTALLLALSIGIHHTHGTIDLEEIAEAERKETESTEAREEQEEQHDQEVHA